VWEALRRRGVDERYVKIVKDMYKGARTSVKTESGVSDSFEVRIGVHQGSALSPYLFILVLDVVLSGVIKEVPWCMLFADDMVIIGETVEEVQETLERVTEALESNGLKVNREKTEHLEGRWRGAISSEGRVRIQGAELNKVAQYKYLGSMVQEDGEIEREVTGRIQAGWAKFRMASGVLCDRKIPMKLKGKFYSTAVRPAMMYGSECWAIKKMQEHKMQVAEMRMLRMMCGVTRRDRIENEYVRENLGVESICDRLAQGRLRWYGHVMRRQADDVVKKVWKEEQGGKRGRGRPELTWDAVIRRDMKERGLEDSMVWDRHEWRLSIRIPTPGKLGK
jgi:hypothetical protein